MRAGKGRVRPFSKNRDHGEHELIVVDFDRLLVAVRVLKLDLGLVLLSIEVDAVDPVLDGLNERPSLFIVLFIACSELQSPRPDLAGEEETNLAVIPLDGSCGDARIDIVIPPFASR